LGWDTLGQDTIGHNFDLNKPATLNQFGRRRIDAGGIDAGRSGEVPDVVTLKSGQQDAEVQRPRVV
jgi:hypothetical protein